jgi:hypothetical protein
MTCDHPSVEGGEIIEPREFVQAFGPTVGKSVPTYPGYNLVKNEANNQVSLSRLECGHYLMTSAYTVAQARAQAAATLMAEHPSLSAKAAYTALLEKAFQGEDVSAREAAEAQAAILLEEKAEEGRRQRAEAERLRAERAHRKAVAGPVRQELEESRENLQNAQDEAFRAIMVMLDLVDQDHKAHDDAIAQLLDGGFSQEDIKPPARGYLHQTVADGEAFPIWPKMEHLVAVLNAVKATRHRNAFYSTEGRDLGKNLPTPIPNGPAINPGADEG